MKDPELGVEDPRYHPSHETCRHGQKKGRIRINATRDGDGGNSRPEGKTAVHRQIREIKDAECKIYTQGHESIGETLFQSPDEGIPSHKESTYTLMRSPRC